MDNDKISAIRRMTADAESEINRKEYTLIKKINEVISEVSESADPAGAKARLQKLRALKIQLQSTASQARQSIRETAKSLMTPADEDFAQNRRSLSDLNKKYL